MKKRKRRKVTKRFIAFIVIVVILIIVGISKAVKSIKTKKTSAEVQNNLEAIHNKIDNEGKENKEIKDWRLKLANYDNILPEDFEIELSNIDENRQFDSRAIKYLNTMLDDMRKDGITNIWVQSAYRSVKSQRKLYDNSVKKYLDQGKSKKEAEELTLKYINKPGASDHNLGLAVDFNNVDQDFEKMKGFEWLTENAEKYGFILRYPIDKENITKINYEPWHWRYVGQEHAQKMNELNMCLEEYVKYLQKN